MKKWISFLLAVILTVSCTACARPQAAEEPRLIEPELSQMKSICELAVLECYYHNVAKYKEEDAEGFLFWKKDKHFWVEYSGIVKLGIDVSQVKMEIHGTEVRITLPPAQVLGCEVDEGSLTPDSYIFDKDSAKTDVMDEVTAFNEAQKDMTDSAAENTVLLAEAQQRAKSLLEEYVMNIGRAVGRAYTIEWVYPDGTAAKTEETQQDTAA